MLPKIGANGWAKEARCPLKSAREQRVPVVRYSGSAVLKCGEDRDKCVQF